jgi:hypothetical protein
LCPQVAARLAASVQGKPTDPVDRVQRIAALVTANAQRSTASFSRWPMRLATCGEPAPKKIVEALLDRVK